jgi:dihydrolipoamide dehydrogenase
VSEGLGYEEAGVAMDRGYVKVDQFCRTSVPGVYAVGDLIPTLQLAHVGFAEGILVAEHIASQAGTYDGPVVPIDYDGVPRVTYSHPEVASVGLSEAAAKAKYGDANIKTFNYDLAGNGKSKILKTSGQVKVVQEVDGPVVGIHMVGDRMGELVGEAQLIFNWEALPTDVAQLVHAHPSQTEAMGEAMMALAGKPLHVHD